MSTSNTPINKGKKTNKNNLINSLILYLFILIFVCCSSATRTTTNSIKHNYSPVKMEMYLSAFGVEADGFPIINANIDFVNRKSSCEVSYYEPYIKSHNYQLTSLEIDTIKSLIETTDLDKLKKEYKVDWSDQPTSTVKIITADKTFEIKDYGLEGQYPLMELYRIVYKLHSNF